MGFGWPAHSFWIESTGSTIRTFYIAAGNLRWPWRWTANPDEAAIFLSEAVATKFYQKRSHSGIGLAVRRAWYGRANGS